VRKGRREVGGERGSGTLLAALVVALVAALAAAGVVWGLIALRAHRVDGAADLTALAGARAVRAGRVPCPEAGRTAVANGVRLTACTTAGDELEFVVAVAGEGDLRLGVWSGTLRGSANAGQVSAGGASAQETQPEGASAAAGSP